MQTLELVEAELTGTLPDLSPLVNLRNLTLSGIGMVGTLPESLAHLHSSLQLLNVEHNHLHGQLSPDLRALTNLQELRLAYNNFQGSVPESLSDLEELCKYDIGLANSK